jgi:hypothetical protein
MVAAALAIRQLQAAQRSEVEAFPDLVSCVKRASVYERPACKPGAHCRTNNLECALAAVWVGGVCRLRSPVRSCGAFVLGTCATRAVVHE